MKHFQNKDILIIGAGPAGLTAAVETASRGAGTIIVEEAPNPGGRLPSQIHPAPGQKNTWTNGPKTATGLIAEARAKGAEIMTGAQILGLWRKDDYWFAALAPTNPHQKADVFGFRAKAVLIATGAAQNPVVFPGWNLPGVITAGAAQTMINVHRVLPGQKVAIIGADPLALSAAQLMISVGVTVRGIVLPPKNGLNPGPDTPPEALETLARFSAYAPGRLLPFLGRLAGQGSHIIAALYPAKGLTLAGIPLMIRRAAVAAQGTDRVSELKIKTVKANGEFSGREENWPVDAVITSAGLHPLVELAVATGCPVVQTPQLGGWIPVHGPGLETPCPGLFVAGSITGIEGSEVARAQGRLAGLSAAGCLGQLNKNDLEQKKSTARKEIDQARKKSLPFLPDIIEGREIMKGHWNKNRSLAA